MAILGYARVSTLDQHLDLQLDALKRAGCERVYADKISGSTVSRKQLDKCLAALKPGDTLCVWKMDRLGRSLGHLIAMLDGLRDRGVEFKSTTEGVDTASPAGRALWQMLGVFAEFERGVIRERTRAGLVAAKARGARLGQPPKLSAEQIEHAQGLRGQGKRPHEIAALLGVSERTIYRATTHPDDLPGAA
jgi:DNA invertase Pin-like site-specific DNA recombinase